jgi:uncharacterized membrane protein
LNITKYAPFIEKAQASFWFVPSLMVLSSIALAVCTIYFDSFYIDQIEISIPLIYGTDIDAIRSLLGTIAGAMITVTSIAFSSTIVALTLASSQFGPRLLRNFMMDTGTQIVLGSFISNFMFCILVICAISFQKPYAFEPGITVIVAMTMTCISVGVLIYFIHHVAKSIQADVVIDEVYRELQTSIRNLFPDTQTQAVSVPEVSTCSYQVMRNKTQILASCSGYVETIDHKRLLKHCSNSDLVIECALGPGNFITQGFILATVYSECEIDKKLLEQTSACIGLGAYRTPVQDPEFAIHQLVEIALRALSPGINDPYTAITCIDKLNSVLCALTKKQFPAKQHYDDKGALRLICKDLAFSDIAKASYDQIRQHANSNVAVTIRLLDSLYDLLFAAQTDEQRQFVIKQTQMIDAQQSKQSLAEDDAQAILEKVTSIFSQDKRGSK